MHNSTFPKLSEFGAKLKNITPGFFTNIPLDSDLVGLSEVSELSKWVQKEKFLNFSGLQISVPQGFSGSFIEYISTLEVIWRHLQNIENGILKPVNTVLAGFANNTDLLRLPIAFKMDDFIYELKGQDPEKFKKDIANYFKAGKLDTAKFDKVFNSAGDMVLVYNRAEQLNKELTKFKSKNIDKLIESITSSVNVICEYDIESHLAKELVKLVDLSDSWVELLGLYMTQTTQLFNMINESYKAVRRLYKK